MNVVDKLEFDTAWILICAMLVFLMQAGFCCLESGLVRSKNSINVAIKNLADFCVAALVFWICGYALMFGSSQYGFIGTSGFCLNGFDNSWLTAFFIFQLVFCSAAVTIVSGAVAERIKFSGYLLVALFVSLVIYPVVGHWIWGGAAAGASQGWLAQLGFVDFAGSTVVHCVGGWIALAAVLVVGPRIGRFDSDEFAPNGNNIPFTVLGGFLLWFGWFGFNGGSTLEFNQQVPKIMLNTCMSGVAGGVIALLIVWYRTGKPAVDVTVNGVLSGLVGVTASAHVISPRDAVLIGIVAGAVHWFATGAMIRAKIDDAVGAVPVHLCAGLWGTLAVALFADLDLLGTGLDRWQQLRVQLIGAGAVCVWSFGLGLVVLKLVHFIHPLRVSREVEIQGLNISEHGASTEILELLRDMDVQRRSGDFSRRVRATSGTEIGQVANQYNRVLAVVESEIAREKELTEQLRSTEQATRRIIETANDAFFSTNRDGILIEWSDRATELFGWSRSAILGKRLVDTILPDNNLSSSAAASPKDAARTHQNTRLEASARHRDGNRIPVELSVSQMTRNGMLIYNTFAHNISTRKKLQARLGQAQKLESIGQLAAGVAHEINTPIQFIGDNTQFLQNAFNHLAQLSEKLQRVLSLSEDDYISDEMIQEMEKLVEVIQKKRLLKEIPVAIEDSLSGIDHISRIVQSMKSFSHPGSTSKSAACLNSMIENTLMVTRNEWKQIAEVELRLEPSLVPVTCYVTEINQVFLNLIVNAAHAIADKNAGRGALRIRTRMVDRWVEVEVSDTGIGIPPENCGKIFDPFFTTKDVGVGTGQGLAISWDVVVNKHGGSLEVHSEPGVGTTFVVRLPSIAEETLPERNNAHTGC